MDRTSRRKDDLIQSVLRLCDFNYVEAEMIFNGPVSMYEAKVKAYISRYKSSKPKENPGATNSNNKGKFKPTNKFKPQKPGK